MTIENKIKRVRELDQAATPGPWRYESGWFGAEAPNGYEPFVTDSRPDAALLAAYRTLAPELADECERLRDRATLLEGKMNIENPSKYKTALEDAFDECSKLLDGNDRWEYAGQMVRAVQSVVEERDEALEKVKELEKELKTLKDKQVNLIAKAYDEGRNYVDDRDSEE